MPTYGIFFRFLGQGLRDIGRPPNFEKIGGRQTAKHLQGPLHKNIKIFLRNTLEKRRECAVAEPKFSFSI